MIDKIVLIPSCSEWTDILELNEEELNFVISVIDKLNIQLSNYADKKHLSIDEDIVDDSDYNFLTGLLDELRRGESGKELFNNVIPKYITEIL